MTEFQQGCNAASAHRPVQATKKAASGRRRRRRKRESLINVEPMSAECSHSTFVLPSHIRYTTSIPSALFDLSPVHEGKVQLARLPSKRSGRCGHRLVALLLLFPSTLQTFQSHNLLRPIPSSFARAPILPSLTLQPVIVQGSGKLASPHPSASIDSACTPHIGQSTRSEPYHFSFLAAASKAHHL